MLLVRRGLGAPRTLLLVALCVSSARASPRTSSASAIGGRPAMEDYAVVSGDARFLGVFDGHGGREVARYLSHSLYPLVLRNLAEKADFSRSERETALRAAAGTISGQIDAIKVWRRQGSTACVVLLDSAHDASTVSAFTVMNVGDSRAVLSRGGHAVELSRDHKPSEAGERRRIEALGGVVKWHGLLDRRNRPVAGTGVHRIKGLALSRAFGDAELRPFVSSTPDIESWTVTERDEFIVLATDGLWDAFTSEEAVRFVHECIRGSSMEVLVAEGMATNARGLACRALVLEALRRGSSDNTTVVIAWLK